MRLGMYLSAPLSVLLFFAILVTITLTVKGKAVFAFKMSFFNEVPKKTSRAAVACVRCSFNTSLQTVYQPFLLFIVVHSFKCWHFRFVWPLCHHDLYLFMYICAIHLLCYKLYLTHPFFFLSELNLKQKKGFSRIKDQTFFAGNVQFSVHYMRRLQMN